LQDASVEGYHALAANGDFHLLDEGSTANMVNYHPVSREHQLEHGDRSRFGGVGYRYVERTRQEETVVKLGTAA
jgi:hypothetical protein